MASNMKQSLIVLFYVLVSLDRSEDWLQDDVCPLQAITIDAQEADARAGRSRGVDIPGPEVKVASSPILAQSVNVTKYDQHEGKSSVYWMDCGLDRELFDTGAQARCMPDTNEIVEIGTDAEMTQRHCLRIVICKPGTGAEICDRDSIAIWFPEKKKVVTTNGAKNAASSYKVKEGDIVYIVDPGCELTIPGKHKLRHRFQNKGEEIRKELREWPGFYLQPTFYHPRRLFEGGNRITFGGKMHYGVETQKHTRCDAKCDLGRLFYYKMTENAIFYSRIFVEGAKCDWMKICLQGKGLEKNPSFRCDDQNMVYVYIRNGFVVMPGARNGIPIRFVKSTKGKGLDRFTRRPTQIGFEFDGRFSIWSVGRERATSTRDTKHDGHLILYFSHHDCLVKGQGIQNLAKDGYVYQIKGETWSIDEVSKGKDDTFQDLGTVATRGTLGTMGTPSRPEAPVGALKTTTKKQDIVGIDGVGGKVKKGRSGWNIMMMFAGFFCGSLVALLISGSLLYFGRRTVYSNWYRGMYKRYGCDASGVTGGVTGSAFGSTTAGGEYSTVAGGTTASTFGGTTGSTFGGTTTSGETSGMSGETTGATTGTTGTTGTTSGFTSGDTTGATSGITGDTTGTTGATSGAEMVAM